MRALLRWLRRGALVGFAGLAIYALAAAIGALLPGPVVAPMPDGAPVEIALYSGPIHVDFILPATPETRDALRPFEAAGVPVDAPQVRHFLVGWGARDFYTTAGTYADITWPALRRAITGDASVLRVEVLGDLPPDLALTRISLPEAGYTALLDGVRQTMTGPMLDEAGFTPTDGFAEAQGRFHIFRTCNTWISRMLRQAGVPFGAWIPTPYSVRLSAWWHGA